MRYLCKGCSRGRFQLTRKANGVLSDMPRGPQYRCRQDHFCDGGYFRRSSSRRSSLPSRLNLSECLSQSLFPLVRWCWDWVRDCLHCVEPLNIKRQRVKDVQIRSVGYDRRRGRLEVEFTWIDELQ